MGFWAAMVSIIMNIDCWVVFCTHHIPCVQDGLYKEHETWKKKRHPECVCFTDEEGTRWHNEAGTSDMGLTTLSTNLPLDRYVP